MSKCYVTMTDTFMSGWGMAESKINKLILVCDTYDQARLVVQNAMDRSDQKYINIRTTKPYYSPKNYYAQVKTIKDMPNWYDSNRPFA